MSRKINSEAIGKKKPKKEKKEVFVPQEISVFYPEQVFSPVPYNSFRCGNLWYKTFTQPGETPEQAYQRAWKYVSELVKQQYIACRAEFWERYQNMSL